MLIPGSWIVITRMRVILSFTTMKNEYVQEMRKANLTMSRLEDQAKRDSEAVLVAEQVTFNYRLPGW